ncbi:hypothetical protein BGZ60DRAFT_430610 [Tricladium varicosporioides]|nr:hypothetical protein BGZ60DRAFT_430610 [Hymenoscyphus varicosporioides]
MTHLKLDRWGSRWSFARGATKATHIAKGQSMNELTEALAEVDGLLAGINYLETLEPESDDGHSPFSRSDNVDGSLSPTITKDSWFGPLTVDLPQLDASESEEQSKVEIRHLRNLLNEKLVSSSDNSRQIPGKSQWATLRSLRKASMYHYNQFTKVTADSTSADIRKLKKSYLTAKNMLEMGILTFRNVLRGRTPTTLADIFAFASLSYVISKTLHSNGHIDKSDILSGILDWRAAIVDEKERSAFDEIAKRLWPEANEIMHFFPIARRELSPESPGLRHDESKLRCAPSPVPQATFDERSCMPGEECIATQEDPLLSLWAHEYASTFQANTYPIPCPGEAQSPLGGLQDHTYQLIRETMSHDEFAFSTWLNRESTVLEDFTDPSLNQNTAPNIGPEVLTPSQTGCSIGTESAASESPCPPLCGFEAPPPIEDIDPPADDPAHHRLLDTPLFQVVFRFLIDISELGDLLNVLSGGGLTSGKGEIKSNHPLPSFEFLYQALKHFLGPLHREAAHIGDTFSGIVAMAEMFVGLGSLQNVREVENYIITVGRYLSHSYSVFMKLVSKTLNQCLVASQTMQWPLLYPNWAGEIDEYSIEYINKRKEDENHWTYLGFAHLDPSNKKRE